MPEDILRPILDPLPVDPAVKSDVWDHFYQSDSPQDFKQRFDKLAIPDEAKASLWDLKFGQRQPNAPAEPPTPTSALPPPRQTSLPTSTEGQNNRFQIQGPPQFSGPLADPSDPTSRLPTHEEAQQQAAEYARSTVDKIVRVGSPRILGAEPPAPDLRRAGAAVVNPQLTQPAANKLPLEQPSYGDAVEAALAGDFKKAHELGARPPAAVPTLGGSADGLVLLASAQKRPDRGQDNTHAEHDSCLGRLRPPRRSRGDGGRRGRGQPSQAARLRAASEGARNVARILRLSASVTRGASSAHVTA